MSKFKMQINLRTHAGISSSMQEVDIPDSMDSKIGNSSFKDEMLVVVEQNLPEKINGLDWRQKGFKVESFGSSYKI